MAEEHFIHAAQDQTVVTFVNPLARSIGYTASFADRKQQYEERSATAVDDAVYSGVLKKRGKNWSPRKSSTRFCVVKDDVLLYYASSKSTRPRGVINLKNCLVDPNCNPGDSLSFSVTAVMANKGKEDMSGRTYFFFATTEEDKENWLNAIEQAAAWSQSDETKWIYGVFDCRSMLGKELVTVLSELGYNIACITLATSDDAERTAVERRFRKIPNVVSVSFIDESSLETVARSLSDVNVLFLDPPGCSSMNAISYGVIHQASRQRIRKICLLSRVGAEDQSAPSLLRWFGQLESMLGGKFPKDVWSIVRAPWTFEDAWSWVSGQVTDPDSTVYHICETSKLQMTSCRDVATVAIECQKERNGAGVVVMDGGSHVSVVDFLRMADFSNRFITSEDAFQDVEEAVLKARNSLLELYAGDEDFVGMLEDCFRYAREAGTRGPMYTAEAAVDSSDAGPLQKVESFKKYHSTPLEDLATWLANPTINNLMHK